ncbi:uncharacterized protein LOC124355234 isoform X2 [Homalodisca vitripennis]|uniref:uncharacterized protein LOC124355234 isoform X2 n=1 Tax=Homalodisca vitripennis TaxID=197043 RepID=UPI001EEB32AF|nr:uncharacterized protein LOC124355234 isoform X2 [Homalodisca vitripennis]
MEEPRVIVGVRGAELLFYDGYCYRKRRSDSVKLVRWRCSHFTRFSCKGAMVTQMPYNNPRVLEEHNHPPNNAEFEVTLLRLKMRDLAATSTGTLNSLVRMVLREASQEARNLLEPILDGIKRDLRRLRQKLTSGVARQNISYPQKIQGSGWKIAAGENEKSTSACVKIEEEKEFSFETVYCNENFQEVKLEAEYNEAYESTASFLFKSESRAEPAVSYNTASSESPVEIKSESSKDVTQVLDVSGSVTSSEPIENHSVITLERSHNSTSDLDLCRLRHHDSEPSFNVEVGEKGIGAPETTETIVLKRSLPVDKPSERISPSSVTTSETLFNKPSGLPDGQDVLHVISLKKIPKNRRQAAREKITELLDFIVHQDLDPKFLDLKKLVN